MFQTHKSHTSNHQIITLHSLTMSISSSSSDEIIIPPDSSEEWLSGSTFETFLAAYEALEDTTSSTNTRGYVQHFRQRALETLMNDYFVEQPKFNESVFHDRFQ